MSVYILYIYIFLYSIKYSSGSSRVWKSMANERKEEYGMQCDMRSESKVAALKAL